MILDEIVEKRKKYIEKKKAELPEDKLLNRMDKAPFPRSLIKSINSSGKPEARIIAEIKKASPSCGIIKKDFNPVEIARQYETAGACAISVLTEPCFFYGNLEILQKIRFAVNIPVLQKDFIIDPYQVTEARYYGADAILLIVRILSERRLKYMLEQAVELGMEALVEIHNEDELKRAVSIGARLIGINNRNLETFETDIKVSERIARKVPPEIILVSESGIKTKEDIQRLKSAGINVFLIGESLMRCHDPGRKLMEFIS